MTPSRVQDAENPRKRPPPVVDVQLAARRARRRHLSDLIIRRIVAIGGVSIIFAVLLIAFYLFYVVLPLFIPAQIQPQSTYRAPGGVAAPLHLVVDEQNAIGVRIENDQAQFFRVNDGTPISVQPWTTSPAVLRSLTVGDDGYFAGGFANGTALIVKIVFTTSYQQNAATLERVITPSLTYPLGDNPLIIDPQGRALERLAFGTNPDAERLTLIAATADHQILGGNFTRRETLLGDLRVEPELFALGTVPNLAYLLFSVPYQSLYAIAQNGLTTIYHVPPGNTAPVRSPIKLTPRALWSTQRNYSSAVFL